MENNGEIVKQEICIIKIVFPVASDDDAIAIKKKIGEVMKETPAAAINFSLIEGRPPVPGM